MNKFIVTPKLHSFFQNRAGLLAISLSLALLLSACGAVAAQPTQAVPAQVGTDVAATLTAQPTATATSTMTPTMTPTTTLTPTVASTVGIPVSGATSSSFSNSAFGCNNATFVKDVNIPDGTVLARGQGFTKTWRLQNTGTCKWTKNYSLVFVGGSGLGGSSVGIGGNVPVGKKDDISVQLIAPNVDGTYIGFWRMADQNGNLFGETIDVQIVVEQGVVATVVVTATPVPPTATPTP